MPPAQHNPVRRTRQPRCGNNLRCCVRYAYGCGGGALAWRIRVAVAIFGLGQRRILGQSGNGGGTPALHLAASVVAVPAAATTVPAGNPAILKLCVDLANRGYMSDEAPQHSNRPGGYCGANQRSRRRPLTQGVVHRYGGVPGGGTGGWAQWHAAGTQTGYSSRAQSSSSSGSCI